MQNSRCLSPAAKPGVLSNCFHHPVAALSSKFLLNYLQKFRCLCRLIIAFMLVSYHLVRGALLRVTFW
jgi:hypothetical protein